METAKRFCGADAPAFVNGILATVLREQREGTPAAGDPQSHAQSG